MRGGKVSGRGFRGTAAALAALVVLGGPLGAPAYADGGPGLAAAGDCPKPAPDVPTVPWSLQRLLLDELWQGGKTTGAGVTVAVIDTGVDDRNPQLAGKVDAGPSLLFNKEANKPVDGTSKDDTVGHGTKVAGIIAAGRSDRTGFVGLAPDARILAIRQNDSEGNGDVSTLVTAIHKAIEAKVRVINISQDVRGAGDAHFGGYQDLKAEIEAAEKADIVVVASSGNDGKEGDTYPGAFPTVLSVGASDRNNERAPFSQYGSFVKVAAPGVDMLSTVPGGGQCVDNGTSFAAPYVSGLAALLIGAHPNWTAAQVRAWIEQTAQRTEREPNRYIGWGVVDPVKAVTKAPDVAPSAATPDAPVQLAAAPIVPRPVGLGETQADRDGRTATYVVGTGALLVALLIGGGVVLRDRRRRFAD
ncbi:type VII secretion-associated serine protease mycosin [Streptomyces sp. FH025]|uniref:type VII secretion-associated serine protease mycosin n=1 Tax=Streptomyces sp. FH025 TaxID=2815937 RepID=UPI001A9DA09C|nr:type VII secretion-associated serine protease mycosin [Streptomyces sp. FH025]MBO1417171.1 type VII secretion-associated serine protease mycosin [Streptomyces sp. FH025]